MDEVTVATTVKTIAQRIAYYPDRVTVNETPSNTASIIEVRVDPDDLGKMIGKNGKTAQAIRTIVYASSFKDNKRYNIEFLKQDQ